MLKQLWPLVLGSVALGLDAYVIAGLISQIANDLGTSGSVIGLGVTAFTGAYAISGPLFSGRAGKDPRSGLLGAVAVFFFGECRDCSLAHSERFSRVALNRRCGSGNLFAVVLSRSGDVCPSKVSRARTVNGAGWLSGGNCRGRTGGIGGS